MLNFSLSPSIFIFFNKHHLLNADATLAQFNIELSGNKDSYGSNLYN